jgi:hypothetical protein
MQPSQFPLPFDAAGNLILSGIHAPDGSWSIDAAGNMSAQNMTVVNSTGLVVAGVDILSTLENRPSGLEAYDIIQSGTDTAEIGTTETVAFRCTTSNVYNVRIYRFMLKCHIVPSAALGMDVIIRYTTDGSTPTTASAELVRFRKRFDSINGEDVAFFKYYSPAQDYTAIRLAICLLVSSGGTVHIIQTSGVRPLEFGWEDVGLDLVVGNGKLAQISKSSGSPDPDPGTQFVKTYSPTDSNSYQSNGNVNTAANGHVFQGYFSGTNGNQFSLIALPYTTIQSDLSGSTINKTEVYLKNLHWYNNSGGTAVIGTHTYGTVTGNADYANVNPDISESSFTYGQGKWVTVNNSIGAALRDNTAKGIALGKGPSTSHTYYGYFAGAGQSGQPQVRITYTK